MYQQTVKTLSLLFLLWLGLINTALAQAPDHVPVIDVVHIDILPPNVDNATQLLRIYHYETLKETGITSCKIYQQVGRPNHFTLVEEWADQAAYDAHLADAHTRQFREKIQPMLGGPLDERLHTELE